MTHSTRTPADATPAAPGPTKPRVSVGTLLRSVDRRLIAMGVVFIALTIFFHVASDGIFFSSRNLSLLLRQAAVVGILAAGVSVLMIKGEIDLSIGSAVFLTGVVAAKLGVDAGAPTLVSVLGAVAAGCVLGAWQGFWVVRLAVPSFVVTLAGLLIFRGLGLLWTNAETVSPLSQSYISLSESFISPGLSYVLLAAIFGIALGLMLRRARADRRFGLTVSTESMVVRLVGIVVAFGFLAWIAGGFLGIPMAVVWAAGVGVLLTIVMTKTPFGRNAYLVGSNREAARFSGISVKRQVFLGFVLMGAIYGVGGVLLTSRLGGVTPQMGQSLELDAIAAAVIGGTSLAGGIGTVAGAMGGALLLATIDNGMSLLDISSFAQLIVKGLVLLGALAVDTFVNRRSAGRA
jgi:D-xylose transport system permease protein